MAHHCKSIWLVGHLRLCVVVALHATVSGGQPAVSSSRQGQTKCSHLAVRSWIEPKGVASGRALFFCLDRSPWINGAPHGGVAVRARAVAVLSSSFAEGRRPAA